MAVRLKKTYQPKGKGKVPKKVPNLISAVPVDYENFGIFGKERKVN